MSQAHLFTNMTLAPDLSSKPYVHHELPETINDKAEWQDCLRYLVTDLGWTEEFTDGDDKMVLRPAAGARPYIRFEWGKPDDRMIDVRMFESMTDIDTGVNQTPTSGQRGTYGLQIRSAVGDTGNVDWFLLADEERVLISPRSTQSGRGYQFGLITVGGYNAYDAGDMGALIWCNPSVGINVSYSYGPIRGADDISRSGGPYVFRKLDGTGTSTALRQIENMGMGSTQYNAGVSSGAALEFPDPASGQLVMGPVIVREGRSLRGVVPGIMTHAHYSERVTGLVTNLAPTLLPGQGDFAGREFIAVPTIVDTRPAYNTLILELWK